MPENETKDRVKAVKLTLAVVLYLVANTLLLIYAGVEVLLAVYLFVWANNITIKKD